MLSITAMSGAKKRIPSSWKLDASITAVSIASSLSATAENAVPMLPTTWEGMCAHFRMRSMSMTAVVLPLVPVTAICSAAQKRDANSSSPMTCLPASLASRSNSLSERTPGLVTTMSQSRKTAVLEVEWLFLGLSS